MSFSPDSKYCAGLVFRVWWSSFKDRFDIWEILSLFLFIENQSVEVPLLIRLLSQICGIHWSDYQATQSNMGSLLSLSQAPRCKPSTTSTWSELVELTKSSIKRTFDLFHSLAIKLMSSNPFQSIPKSSNGKNSIDTALSYCTEIIDFLDTLLERSEFLNFSWYFFSLHSI